MCSAESWQVLVPGPAALTGNLTLMKGVHAPVSSSGRFPNPASAWSNYTHTHTHTHFLIIIPEFLRRPGAEH